MDEHSFKQRIVGAIVLVALAVIFVPMILSGNRDRDFIDADTVIPEKPPELQSLRVLEIENPVPPPRAEETVRIPIDERSPSAAPAPATGKVPKAPAAPRASAGEPAKPAAPAPGKAPSTARQGEALAWAVQVASFRKRDNALALKAKLAKQGFPAFVEKVTLAGGQPRYRVRVGPWVKKADAEAQRKRILARFKLEGLVVRHP